MPIHHPPRPGDVVGILRPYLQGSLHRSHRAREAGLRGDGKVRVEVSSPHACYFVGLAGVAGGVPLQQAKPSAWRSLVFVGERAVADARMVAKGDALAFAALHHGPMAESAVEVLRRAEARDDVRRHVYELRYLEIPALHFAGVWLHPLHPGEGEDLIHPTDPTPSHVAPRGWYTEHELRERLRPLAANQAAG